MLNDELLLVLLRFNDKQSKWAHDSGVEDANELCGMGCLKCEPNGFYRITKRGFAITSAAISAANGISACATSN